MQNCKNCTFKKWIKPSKDEQQWKWVEGHKVRIWICGRCGQKQAEQPAFRETPPHILYLDIETSLVKTFAWGLHVPNKYLNPMLLLTDYFIITWAASWVGETKVYSGAVTGAQAKKQNDKQCIRELWNLIDEADIVAGHNLDRFDIKKVQTRFLLNNMPKPRTFRTMDTLKIIRKHFSFLSNRLDFVSPKLGFGVKDDMELDDWLKICLEGDEARIAKMLKYNIGDVRNGKKVLERLLPWIHPYPVKPRGGYKDLYKS